MKKKANPNLTEYIDATCNVCGTVTAWLEADEAIMRMGMISTGQGTVCGYIFTYRCGNCKTHVRFDENALMIQVVATRDKRTKKSSVT